MGSFLISILLFKALVLLFFGSFGSSAFAGNLTDTQRAACEQVPTAARLSCTKRYTETNAVDQAARQRDENLTSARMSTPPSRNQPDVTCQFEMYVAQCAQAIDAAVLVFKESFASTSDGTKRRRLERASRQCEATCAEQTSRLAQDQGCHTRINKAYDESRREELAQITYKCGTPENVGVPASNAQADLDARRTLAEGQSPSGAIYSTTPVASETCVRQSTGVDYCRAVGIGTNTPAFYYRDATGAVYQTHEAATITGRQMPAPRAKERELVRGVPDEAEASTAVRPGDFEIDTPQVATTADSQANSEPRYTSTGAFIPQPVEEEPVPQSAPPTAAVTPPLPRASDSIYAAQQSLGTMQVAQSASSFGSGYSSSSLANFASGSSSPSGMRSSSSETVGGDYGGGGNGPSSGYDSSSSGGVRGNPNQRTASANSPGAESRLLPHPYGPPVIGGLPGTSNAGANQNVSAASTSQMSASASANFQLSSSFYRGGKRSPAPVRGRSAQSGAKKVSGKIKIRDCNGDIRCILKGSGLSEVRFKNVRYKSRDRDLASMGNSPYPSDIARGIQDILTLNAIFFNRTFELDHEGLIRQD
jgi:hypothetical protein